MKIKIRAFGWINLVHLLITIIVILLCILTPLYYFLVIKNYNLFLLMPLVFIYPLIIHFVQTFNRYIMVDGDRLIFQLDNEKGNFLAWPKFYKDEFSLKDIKYYGDFSALYIKGYEKAQRPDKKNKTVSSVGRYDIIEVSEGKLKVPVGSILIGNPLAFVFNKNQYIIDDYLFSPEQYEALFYVINKNCNIEPSGGIKAIMRQHNSSESLFAFLLLILGGLVAIGLPFLVIYLFQTYTSLAISLNNIRPAETAFLFFFIFSNLCMVLYYRLKVIKSRNFASYDLIGFLATICAIIGYLAAIVIFIFTYLI